MLKIMSSTATFDYYFLPCELYMFCPIFEKITFVNPLDANFTKWSNTLKQFVSNLVTNCLSVLDHFVGLVLKGLTDTYNH